ncbi:MAG: HYR domain-containing protein, partial [candidate division Zixibacteria bacterium]|nr:HYR domain-containing protein [candidate division Zixibacteria bacterium]
MRYGHGCLTVWRRKTASATCRLFPLLVLIAIIVFVPSIHANAEECMGPPDDLYCPDSTGIDTSSSSASIYDKPYQSNQTGMMAGTQSVDTVSVTQIDPANFPDICTYVEVLDDNGDPLGGLDADSFCVYQDTVQIDSFTVTELTLDSCITSICLVIDISGSMNLENKLVDAKASAISFINQMDVHDRVAIVTFNSCYAVAQDFTSNQTLLTNAINSLTAGGRTAALDGIYQGLQLTIPELGSKAVIAFSDGMENNSYWCAGGPDGLYNGFANDSTLIVGSALGAGVPIYTISLGSTFDPQYLIGIANGSGADYFHAPTGGDIAGIYDEIKSRLCSRYEICFVSPDTTKNGDWHDVMICRKDSAGDCGPCGTTPYQEPDPPTIVRTPPTIDLELTCQYWELDLDICAWVLDADTPAESLTVRLFYRSVSGGSFTSVTMNRTDSLFCYTIPGSEIPCGTDSLDYYLTASDGQVTVSNPSMAPGTHHAIPICPNSAPVCSAPDDTTFVQCTPEEVCLPVGCSDPDGNLESGPTIISGPGTINAGQWCYTPAGTEVASVTIECVDSCGVSCQASFNVTFDLDNNPPIVQCPGDITVGNDPGECGAVVTWTATADDECPGVTVSCTPPSGTLFSLGSTVVTCIATDAGGLKDTCEFTITVNDTVAPQITCPADLTFECDAVGSFGAPTATDNCDASPTITVATRDSIPGSCPQEYTLELTYEAEDDYGNTDQCQQTITVQDTTPPSISCPAPETVECESDVPAPDVNLVTASDNCGAVTVTHVGDSPISGGVFTRTYRAEDECGNTSDCTQEITIDDTTPPSITCPADVTVECLADVPAPDINTVSTSDNCGGTVTVVHVDDVSDGQSCPETITRTYRATDESGNSAECTQTITVDDTTPPVISCPADLTFECDNVGAFGTASATDNCDADPTIA